MKRKYTYEIDENGKLIKVPKEIKIYLNFQVWQ
jgi:hypothetical protein